MTALPGTPAIQNAIPMAFFGTTLFAAPGLGILASAVIIGFGLWWLRLMEMRARGRRSLQRGNACDRRYSSYASAQRTPTISTPPNCRTAIEASSCRLLRCSDADPDRVRGQPHDESVGAAANIYWVSRRAAVGETSLSAVSGAWSVVTALPIASLVLAVAPATPAGIAQDPRCWRQRFRVACLNTASLWVSAAWWRRCLRSPWFVTDFGGSRRAAGVDRRRRQRHGWHYRLGFGRLDHRAELVRPNLRPAGGDRGHRP